MVTPEYDPHGPDAPGSKRDGGKPLAWLTIRMFGRSLSQVVRVTTFGAQKYAPENWAKVPDGENRYMEAAGRHLLCLARGEALDPETGASHKAHAAWNLLCSLELELRRQDEALNA